MTTQIKICGLSRPEEIAAAVDAGATHIGLVHFEPSPRHVSLDQAERLRMQVPTHVKTVLLMVNPDGITISKAARVIIPDIIQFHGDEPPEALSLAKKHTDCAVWKALPVRDAASLAHAADYADVADMVLLDAPAPEGSALPGGNGEAFGWGLLKGHEHQVPWGLAGGLNPGNVAEAIRATGAPLVDVSSGVESARAGERGVKDVDKIAAFCKAALDA